MARGLEFDPVSPGSRRGLLVVFARVNPKAKPENAHEQTNDAASPQPDTSVGDRRYSKGRSPMKKFPVTCHTTAIEKAASS